MNLVKILTCSKLTIETVEKGVKCVKSGSFVKFENFLQLFSSIYILNFKHVMFARKLIEL